MGLPRTLQPVILWINQQGAANRRKANLEQPEENVEADNDQQMRDAVVRFCSVFPDRFFVSERGRTFLDPKRQNKLGDELEKQYTLKIYLFVKIAPRMFVWTFFLASPPNARSAEFFIFLYFSIEKSK